MSYHLDEQEFYELCHVGDFDTIWDAYEYAVKGGESAPKLYASQEKLREPLAECAHNAWGDWMEYMFSKFEPHVPITYSGQGRWVHLKLPTAFYERWRRQMETAYADLPESEKESDREQADKILEVLQLEENSAVMRAFEKLTDPDPVLTSRIENERKRAEMIVDEQHLQLHETAQEVCLSLNMDGFILMPDKCQKAMQDLAMYCGCSHVPWFSYKVYEVEDK